MVPKVSCHVLTVGLPQRPCGGETAMVTLYATPAVSVHLLQLASCNATCTFTSLRNACLLQGTPRVPPFLLPCHTSLTLHVFSYPGLYLKARRTSRPISLARTPTPTSTEHAPPPAATSPPQVPSPPAMPTPAASPHEQQQKHGGGTCPGDGRCDGTGGTSACAGCPTYNNSSQLPR